MEALINLSAVLASICVVRPECAKSIIATMDSHNISIDTVIAILHDYIEELRGLDEEAALDRAYLTSLEGLHDGLIDRLP